MMVVGLDVLSNDHDEKSHIHSPSIIAMGLGIHMPEECMEREQSRIGILIHRDVTFQIFF